VNIEEAAEQIAGFNEFLEQAASPIARATLVQPR